MILFGSALLSARRPPVPIRRPNKAEWSIVDPRMSFRAAAVRPDVLIDSPYTTSHNPTRRAVYSSYAKRAATTDNHYHRGSRSGGGALLSPPLHLASLCGFGLPRAGALVG